MESVGPSTVCREPPAQYRAASCATYRSFRPPPTTPARGVHAPRLLRALEDGYPASNPYHNATHAADVLRTLSVLLRGARLTAHYAHGLGLLASYFAAVRTRAWGC